MIFVVRIYQLLNICAIVCNIMRARLSQKDEWNYLCIADWVYYLCGVIASTLSFGIIAILEENPMGRGDLLVGFVFIVSCAISTCLMILQKVWRIQYNDEILIFRNSFGIVRQYKIDELVLSESGRLCGILHNEKKIIQWDTLIMNTNEEISLCRFLLRGNHTYKS